MSKAYDKAKWMFLQSVMLKMEFRVNWVNLVIGYLKTVALSFVINGEPCGWVQLRTGLRQYDPILPYLFLFCVEALSHLIIKAAETGWISGHKVYYLAPSISHLLFADDSLIFCKVNRDQVMVVKEILSDYECALGQQVNYDKTIVVYSCGNRQSYKDEVLITLDIRKVLSYEKYLGLLMHIGHSTKKKLFPYQGSS